VDGRAILGLLASVMIVFLLDFAAERFVEVKYGYTNTRTDVEGIITEHGQSHRAQPSSDQNDLQPTPEPAPKVSKNDHVEKGDHHIPSLKPGVTNEERSFRQQIALEFGIIFHSAIIGLKLGTAGPEFSTLYPVTVFHQSFEGLGIGACLSAIPIPKRLSWLPWLLCTGYGVTTPIAIAIGLGVRTTYVSDSFTASIAAGVLDATSVGILIYNGLVELLARDFIFNPERIRDNTRLTFMIVCLFLGTGLMAQLGKWA
jgi:solute carrier family 39 (zinc transporter), member 1/2/3